ncbi:MAG TPA: cyanophycinase [Chloroflexia bacterium]|nr:cyanophycinase [Chloroflexia bacterium]
MDKKPKGTLIIIGGHEEKAGDRVILTEVSKRARQGKGHLVLTTVASQVPKELEEEYRKVFAELGVRRVDALSIRMREEAYDDANVKTIMKASAVFFTGGDQLRITSQIGDSPIYRCLTDIYQNGGTIIGTSAGAAAMSETMLIGGPGDASHEISALSMAPGLGLLAGVVIDTHFAERGRIGRLLGVVAQNPKNLGLGIDEDTAIVVDKGESFTVIGSGAVYVVDGMDVAYSNLSEENPSGILTIHNIKLHVLGEGDHYDLRNRCPVVPRDVAA